MLKHRGNVLETSLCALIWALSLLCLYKGVSFLLSLTTVHLNAKNIYPICFPTFILVIKSLRSLANSVLVPVFIPQLTNIPVLKDDRTRG